MTYRIHPGAKVGHVDLKVSSLEWAVKFYNNIHGFELRQRFGKGGTFLGAGSYLVELHPDGPPEEWPQGENGMLAKTDDPLDLDALLAEAD